MELLTYNKAGRAALGCLFEQFNRQARQKAGNASSLDDPKLAQVPDRFAESKSLVPAADYLHLTSLAFTLVVLLVRSSESEGMVVLRRVHRGQPDPTILEKGEAVAKQRLDSFAHLLSFYSISLSWQR